MKTPKRIKIVASKPLDRQKGIDHLIGQEFPVTSWEKESQIVGIRADQFGQSLINPGEYEVVE